MNVYIFVSVHDVATLCQAHNLHFITVWNATLCGAHLLTQTHEHTNIYTKDTTTILELILCSVFACVCV